LLSSAGFRALVGVARTARAGSPGQAAPPWAASGRAADDRGRLGSIKRSGSRCRERYVGGREGLDNGPNSPGYDFASG